ncbi:hypothetical protein KUV73_12185 [Mameliella alba]|nr:hypothetical protein [Mameliella alba]MBY6169895.1 hypothetical protein [Mameliella alba]MBY6175128.1 hypothetical protein [Mameliella alba]
MEEALAFTILRVGLLLAEVGYLIVDLALLIRHGPKRWRLQREKRRKAAERRKK